MTSRFIRLVVVLLLISSYVLVVAGGPLASWATVHNTNGKPLTVTAGTAKQPYAPASFLTMRRYISSDPRIDLPSVPAEDLTFEPPCSEAEEFSEHTAPSIESSLVPPGDPCRAPPDS